MIGERSGKGKVRPLLSLGENKNVIVPEASQLPHRLTKHNSPNQVFQGSSCLKVNSIRICTIHVNFERHLVELECRKAMGRSCFLRDYQPGRADDKVTKVISEQLLLYEKQRVKRQGADISFFKDKAVGRYETFGENTG